MTSKSKTTFQVLLWIVLVISSLESGTLNSEKKCLLFFFLRSRRRKNFGTRNIRVTDLQKTGVILIRTFEKEKLWTCVLYSDDDAINYYDTKYSVNDVDDSDINKGANVCDSNNIKDVDDINIRDNDSNNTDIANANTENTLCRTLCCCEISFLLLLLLFCDWGEKLFVQLVQNVSSQISTLHYGHDESFALF